MKTLFLGLAAAAFMGCNTDPCRTTAYHHSVTEPCATTVNQPVMEPRRTAAHQSVHCCRRTASCWDWEPCAVDGFSACTTPGSVAAN